MNNNHHKFDEQIKHKLGGIQTPPMYGSWESFQSKWESAPPTSHVDQEHEFDQKIKSKIHKIQKTSPSDHWEKLRYKLETIELFREKIWLHKTKELIAVLLFLFTFYNVMHHEGKFSDGQYDYAYELNESNDHDIASNRSVSSAFLKPKVEKEKKINQSEPHFVNNMIHQTQKIVAPDELSKQKVYVLTTHNLASSNVKNPTLHLSENTSLQTSLDDSDLETVDGKERVEAIKALKNEPYSLYATNYPMALHTRKRPIKQTRIGVLFSHVDNFILSPYDKVYSIPKFSNSMRNQSYGMTFGKKKNQWEIETGIAYSHLVYKPAEVREIFGKSGEVAFETSLQKIQFDLWKLPVSLRYFMVENAKWKTYVSVGSAINVISQAEYDIEENIVLGRPLHPSQYTNEGPRLEKKPFNKGFIDDGTLQDNFYLDAHLSLGVEKSIGRFATVYLQPTYHTFLFSQGLGIGPNNDKLNAFHLQTGMKWNLNH